jgi:hypothetical protein
MDLRSSRNCFAAASISMQQFHQTCFFRKTFCQRLIERCQTASMLPGLCQTFLCHLDFSRRSGGSRLTPFSLIRQCFVIFVLSVVKYLVVPPVFYNLSVFVLFLSRHCLGGGGCALCG